MKWKIKQLKQSEMRSSFSVKEEGEEENQNTDFG